MICDKHLLNACCVPRQSRKFGVIHEIAILKICRIDDNGTKLDQLVVIRIGANAFDSSRKYPREAECLIILGHNHKVSVVRDFGTDSGLN